jgi:hypothetical protein
MTFLTVVLWWFIGSLALSLLYLYGFHRGPKSMIAWSKQEAIFHFAINKNRTEGDGKKLLEKLDRCDHILELSDDRGLAIGMIIMTTLFAPLILIVWLSETISLYRMGEVRFDETKVRFVLQGGDPKHLNRQDLGDDEDESHTA